jgi:ribosomal-protein-alanine N-acetyltransferase
VLRPWAWGDEPALVRHANDREVWRNLRDRFPHPYTPDDAAAWLRSPEAQGKPPRNFAIVVEREAVGGIGLEPRQDVYRRTAEVGYWIGTRFWRQGLATDALRALVEYAFPTFDLVRLEACVFEWNAASCRVLEKAGFRLEGRLRRSVTKDGHLIDSLLYARLRSE